MICLICRQPEIFDGFASVKFQRGEMHLTVNNVPARVCQSCEEAYVDEDVTMQLLRIAQEMSQAGMSTVVCEYPPIKE
ncbi:MAG: YgiT-type zinc finger protein [Chloroflexi bacterium]|nr:MAG: YgiT-type zinc finger protein [Chloroflexota bacterium]